MSGVILELFPGLGVLGMGFEAEGFTVVKGPDVLWGGDVRTWDATPLRGRIDGVIGGDPCQAHSSLANLVRAKGLEPRFGDLSGEYQRIVEEVQPAWFLRENVPQTPWVLPDGYAVRRFELEHSHLGPTEGEGQVQMRRRAFWFGVPGERWDGPVPELRGHIGHCWFVLPDTETAVGGHDGIALQTGAAAAAEARKRDLEANPDQRRGSDGRRLRAIEAKKARTAPVTGRHEGAVGAPGKDYSPPTRTLAEMLSLQGLPEDLLEHAPYTMQAKRKLVGNAVPLAMAKALARAVKQATA